MGREVSINFGGDGAVLQAFYEDRSRVAFLRGPLGSGKTITVCQRILKTMIEQAPNALGRRPSRWVAIRNTYPDLEGTTIKDWMALNQELGRFTWSSPPTHRVTPRLPDGTQVDAEMIFLALETDQDIRKLRGMQLTGVWFNEAKELAKGVIDMADLRHGRYPSHADGGVAPTWHGMLGDTNSMDTDHWYYRLAEDGRFERPAGWRFFSQPGGVVKAGGQWAPNMAAENLRNFERQGFGNHGSDYYVNALAGKSEDWIKVNLANEYGFSADGKVVWQQYVDSVHCREFDVDKRLPIRIGLDFGLTPSAVIAQRHLNGAWRILDELVSEDMDARVFAGHLRQLIDDRYGSHAIMQMTGDPAGNNRAQADSSTPFQMVNAEGFNAGPASTNDPDLRIAAVTKQLNGLVEGQPRLLIHPRCAVLRRAMQGGYHYKRVAIRNTEKYRDTPNKNQYSHVADALQYLMIGGGGGAEVTSPDEPWKAKKLVYPDMRVV